MAIPTATTALLLSALATRVPAQEPAPAQAPETVHWARSGDGLEIAYELHGQGSPTLVFIHGWSCDRTFFAAQTEHYAASHRVIALDLGGHGQSGRERESWSLVGLAPDVVAVLEAEDVRDAVLVGHSLGGWVATEAANQAPERVLGVIPLDAWQDAEMKLDRAAMDRMTAAWQGDFEGAVRGMVARAFFRPGADPELVRDVTERMLHATTPDIAVAIARSYPDTDYRAMLSALRVPIVCVNSDLIPTKVEVNRKYAPGFDALILKGAGHFAMIEQPRELDAALDQALARVLKARGAGAGSTSGGDPGDSAREGAGTGRDTRAPRKSPAGGSGTGGSGGAGSPGPPARGGSSTQSSPDR